MAEFKTRKTDLKVLSVEQGEGAGARVRRSIGRPELKNFDPFLMLDEFRVPEGAGFPDHPHRGFETVTYMFSGCTEHEDFTGHRGKIGPGDLQWMTAGKGIVHAEMPCGNEIMHGLQLWINLAAKDKMIDPRYQELKKEQVPVAEKNGVTATIIAGKAFGVESPVYTVTPTFYLRFKMNPNSVLEQEIPETMNSFVYTLSGKAKFGEDAEETEAHHTITLTKGDGATGIRVATGESECDFVLLGGEPHNEPIVQYGPFVMNSQEQIMSTMKDYRGGMNGFEKAHSWQSEIGRSLMYK